MQSGVKTPDGTWCMRNTTPLRGGGVALSTSGTTVWPALAPPLKRMTRPAPRSAASASTIFPFPSSPQPQPTTAVTLIGAESYEFWVAFGGGLSSFRGYHAVADV